MLVKGFRFVLPSLPLLLVAAACTAPTDDASSEPAAAAGDPIVSTSSPATGPSVTGDIPALPDVTFGARPPSAPVASRSRTDLHEGLYQNGRDLAPAPVAATDAWLTRVGAGPTTTAAGFSGAAGSATVLANAVASARTGLASDWSEVDRIVDDLGPLRALGARVTRAPFAERSYAYTPERARWLKSQWVTPTCSAGSPAVLCSDARHVYSDPAHFDEIRQRGARMYCAASEAFRNAGTRTRTMGRQAAAVLNVLGERVELLAIEPTVVMSSPDKFGATGADGAQAFAIPMEVGTRLTPISLLPSLPELRTPVTVVTGDSEVVTGSNLGPIRTTTWERVGGIFTPTTRTFDGHRKEWQTVSHADAVLTGDRSIRVEAPKIPLFRVGPIGVGLLLDFTMFSQTSNGGNRRLDAGAPFGWGVARTGGFTSTAPATTDRYNDRAWTLSSFIPSSSPVTVNGGDTTFQTRMLLAPSDPFLARALQDNDKSVEIRTGVGLTAALQADAKVDIENIIELGIEVTGGINGNAAQVHAIREEEHVATRITDGTEFESRTPFPQTSVTVTPSTSADLWFIANGKFVFMLKNLPLVGTIDLGFPLFNTREQIANFRSAPWSERSRLRVGTSTSFDRAPFDATPANPMLRPDVVSHWPQGGSFPSFPSDVNACLAAPAPSGDAPAPCAARPATPRTGPGGTAPAAHVCAYYPANWTGEFSHATTAAQTTCIDSMSTFVRGGTTRRQSYTRDWTFRDVTSRRAELIDARVLHADSPAEMRAYYDIAAQCASAFGSADAASSRLDEVLFAGACTADGQIIDRLISWSPDDVAGRPGVDPAGAAEVCR